MVLAKELPLGTFLATISVFREVSSNFVDGYGGFKKVVSCFEPLVDLTVFLNRPTDVPVLMHCVNQRVEETKARRKETLGAKAKPRAMGPTGPGYKHQAKEPDIWNCKTPFAVDKVDMFFPFFGKSTIGIILAEKPPSLVAANQGN